MSTFSFGDVEFLKLYTNFSDIEMQFIASFLKRFSNLKFLAIPRSSWNDCRSFPQSNVSTSYWESQNLEFVPHLKIVEISLSPGNALELVKYFIKNGEMKYLFVPFSEKLWSSDELIGMIQDLKKDKATARPVVVFKQETLIRSS
ncbi:hypothetical protein AQUCO_02000191v1 [Aquilegia coerulea]|uniref:FBD domain-containing protein n=1 Tax=Aquilegia coerulea TaxID=218851 RepID=A0A2G5DGB4_AQUCA|nr:hypothetical protein AQUCO_02000191v1 [Aquilegia coerulea]PIA42572.1 hypothetical protein AQUCO_02000191v1 [Aquilegia coerulea]